MKECTKTDKKVQILMSTYNGERYLREQLDSIVSLDGFENIKVLIRDDGSKDSTVSILHEYREKYGFEVIEGKNLGVTKSLFEAFQNRDKSCDYFALSDQDDVWKKDKIAAAVKALSQYEKEIPLLYASLSCITDENLQPVGSTVSPLKSPDFFNAMTENITPGHTQVFNQTLMDMLVYSDFINVIDWWIYLTATGCGKVIFQKKEEVYHRQHKKNSVGYELNFWKSTVNRVKRCIRDKDGKFGNQLYSFYKIYQKKISPEYQIELKRFLQCQKNVGTRFQYIIRSKAYRQKRYETILFKILYLFGKYKPKIKNERRL